MWWIKSNIFCVYSLTSKPSNRYRYIFVLSGGFLCLCNRRVRGFIVFYSNLLIQDFNWRMLTMLRRSIGVSTQYKPSSLKLIYTPKKIKTKTWFISLSLILSLKLDSDWSLDTTILFLQLLFSPMQFFWSCCCMDYTLSTFLWRSDEHKIINIAYEHTFQD